MTVAKQSGEWSPCNELIPLVPRQRQSLGTRMRRNPTNKEITMTSSWDRYQQNLCTVPSLGLTLDISRMRFDGGYLQRMSTPIERAIAAMETLERGGIVKADENRMVGHYWLRAPELAPTPAIAEEIRHTLREIRRFADAVHGGTIKTPAGG